MPVLDSSVLIEITKKSETGALIARELEDKEIFITAFTAHEILISNDKTLGAFIEKFDILDYSYEDSVESAEIERELRAGGKMINRTDIFIAGICRRRNLLLFTMDRDFLKIKNIKARIIQK